MAKIKKKHQVKNKIRIPTESHNYFDYPVFCFRHLQTKPKEDHRFYSDFVVRLQQLSTLNWNQINVTDRHGFGTEKIPIKQIKPQVPKFITPEITHLTVFRANGDKRPFLGLRNGIVFHIIYLEEKFGDVYDHN